MIRDYDALADFIVIHLPYLNCLARAWTGLLLSIRRIRLRTLLANLVKDEPGVTAIEYSLIAALIAVAAIASFILIGTDLSTTFSTVAAKI